jgi:polar amino acid transport system substrate-binding protein
MQLKNFSVLSLMLVLLFSGCGQRAFKNTYVIGVDPSWFPLELAGKERYVYGFTDELLQEMSQIAPVHFVKVSMSWDNLLQGLLIQKYDGILSCVKPLPYNREKFDFSEVYLKTGPVLIIPHASKFKRFDDFTNGYIGAVQFTEDELLLQTQTHVLPYPYTSQAAMLSGLLQDQVDGAILGIIPAVSFIEDLYSETLKIVRDPLTSDGLRLMTKKGENKELIKLFNRALSKIQASPKYEELVKKWKVG